jgi:outer membrane protein assembly factor BamB
LAKRKLPILKPAEVVTRLVSLGFEAGGLQAVPGAPSEQGDAASGDPAWEFDAGGGFSAGAAVAAGRVVLASDDGILWCFRSGD